MAVPEAADGTGERPSSATPLLSVVLPNYNHAALLPRALDALLAQERPPDEIIVVDDGSTDDSRTVIAGFATRHPSVRLVAHPANKGAIAALTTGLDAARGRYVYFAAADDWVLPGFFAAAIGMLEAHAQAGLFCGEARLIDGRTGAFQSDRPPVRPIHGTGTVDAAGTRDLLLRIDNWILTGSTVFRRDAVVAAGGFDQRLGSFADGFMARKIALMHGFCYFPQAVAIWCVYGDSYSRRTAGDRARAQAALANVPARLAADSTFPNWYSGVFADRWKFATARLALMAEPIDRELVMAMGGTSPLDRFALGLTLALPTRPTRLTTLAWLWFRLRPTTLTGLAHTALGRRLERLRRPSAEAGPAPPMAASRREDARTQG